MRILIFLFFILFQSFANASIVSQIINNFDSTDSMKFNFVQKINGKIEKGECIIVYPKKIYCKYIDFFNKILVSNGKSLVINSDKNNQYYRYPLDKTPLNLILDKKFIISKMHQLKEDSNYPFYYVFNLNYENNSIKVFFDKNDLNLIGWETQDIYQNIVQTFISDIKKNISVISLTGESEGDIDQYADINIKVPSNDTQRIQEMHILIGHILCDYIEKNSVN